MSSCVTFMWKSVRCNEKRLVEMATAFIKTTSTTITITIAKMTMTRGCFRFGWLLRIRFCNLNGKTTGSQNISTLAFKEFQHSLQMFVCVGKQPKHIYKRWKICHGRKAKRKCYLHEWNCERAKMFVEMIVYAKWMCSEEMREIKYRSATALT